MITNSSNTKEGLIVFLVVYSVSILLVKTHSSIFPWLPLFYVIIGLYIIVRRKIFSITQVTVFTVLSSISFNISVFFFTPSLIGMDPDKIAVAISKIKEIGNITAISKLNFYFTMPLFHIYTTAVSELTGLRAENSLLVYSILFGLLPTLIIVSIVTRYTRDDTPKLIAPLAGGGAAAFQFANLQIPQSLMVLQWLVFVLSFTYYIYLDNKRYLYLTLFFSLCMAYTHKLGMLLPLGVVFFIFLMQFGTIFPKLHSYLDQKSRNYNSKILNFVFIFGVGFLIQMVWITPWIKAVILKIILLRTAPSITTPQFSAVTPLNPGITGMFVEHGSWIVLLLLTLPAIIVLLLFKKFERYSVIVSGAVVSILLLLSAVATPFSLSAERAVIIVEPIFILTIVLGLYELKQKFPITNHVLSLFILLLIISQVFTAAATPDHPAEQREYLNSNEVIAKQFINNHTTDKIYAENFYAQEIVMYRSSRATYITGKGGGYSVNWYPLGPILLNNSFDNQTRKYVVIRSGISTARYKGEWQLKYSPENSLQGKKYSAVYTSGHVTLYSRS